VAEVKSNPLRSPGGDPTNPYVTNPTLDAWLSERAVEALYPDGQPVRVGDFVDFSLDPRSLGIDPVEGPWPGRVVAIRPLGVVVDTYCNSVSPFDPSALKLLLRQAERESPEATEA
jgi:hypothetical protein